ncbi:MAG: hypothetical protein U1F27_11040 [Turneriella sp.]
MRSRLIVFVFAVAPLFAGTRSVELSAAHGYQSAVQTFPDPIYVGENNYVAATAAQSRLRARFQNFFPASFDLAYQALSVQSGEKTLFGKTYTQGGYFSSFLRAGSHIDAGWIRWHFGFAVLATFSSRARYDTGTTQVLREVAVDTRLSQTYPSGGFTLFPHAPIRFHLVFLDGDANLLYGWLRLQVEYESGSHTISTAIELLNHASFGKGMPNFVQPPGALVFGYEYQFGQAKLGARFGLVLNSTQGFDRAHVEPGDRLLIELAAGYRFPVADN